MKYFTPELWLQTQNLLLKDDSPAIVQWTKNVELYNQQYAIAKKHFSNRFISIYEKNDKFHDWVIDGISFISIKNKLNDMLILKISNGNTVYHMKFYNVDNLQFVMRKGEFINTTDKDEYSYDEWHLLEGGRLGYELLMLSFSTISLTCSRVVLAKEVEQVL